MSSLIRWRKLKRIIGKPSPVELEHTPFLFKPFVNIPSEPGTYAVVPYRDSYRPYTPSVESFLYRVKPDGSLEHLEPVAKYIIFDDGGVEVGVAIYRIDGMENLVCAQLLYDESGYIKLIVAAPKGFKHWRRISKALNPILKEMGVEEYEEERLEVNDSNDIPFLECYPSGTTLIALPHLEREGWEEEDFEYTFLFFRYAADEEEWKKKSGDRLYFLGPPELDDCVKLVEAGGNTLFAIACRHKPASDRARLYLFLPTSSIPFHLLYKLLNKVASTFDAPVTEVETLLLEV